MEHIFVEGVGMIYWISRHSVGIFRTMLALGAVSCLTIAVMGGIYDLRLLKIGILACMPLVAISLGGAVIVWLSKKAMGDAYRSMNWHQMTPSHLAEMNGFAKLGFVAQHLAIASVAIAFGWLASAMTVAFIGSK